MNSFMDHLKDYIKHYVITMYTKTTSLITKMEAHKCEFCGNTDSPFEIHHIKKLKNLKGKSNWEN